jgi:hypothetical protein
MRKQVPTNRPQKRTLHSPYAFLNIQTAEKYANTKPHSTCCNNWKQCARSGQYRSQGEVLYIPTLRKVT